MKTRFTLFFIVALLYISHATVDAQPYSDDFYPETTLQSQWRFFDPVGDGSYTMTGTNIEINVPSGDFTRFGHQQFSENSSNCFR
ncbi:MAG: hypothetical protein U5K00_22405 [Melioribacteraceae bacterium]|nr:hypothetical protein [Melioribacteraceae bacterium]